MKTKRALIGTIVIFFAFFLISNGFNRATSSDYKTLIKQDKSDEFSQLWLDNVRLRMNYSKIQSRLDDIEKKMREIDDYDKYIYSQLMGVSSDSTIDVVKYRNDNVSYNQIDSLISNIDNKSQYISELLSIELYNLEMKSKSMKNGASIMNSYPNISPIKTIDFICVTDMYGWRKHPVYKTPLFHDGIDISADPGTKVYSTAQGKVIDVVYSNYGYGNKILIKHNNGYETLYAHLSVMYVKLGQHVKKNQLIGTVGNTGTSTGHHLHYEVHYKNETMNPLAYFYTYLGSNDIKKGIANK